MMYKIAHKLVHTDNRCLKPGKIEKPVISTATLPKSQPPEPTTGNSLSTPGPLLTGIPFLNAVTAPSLETFKVRAGNLQCVEVGQLLETFKIRAGSSSSN